MVFCGHLKRKHYNMGLTCFVLPSPPGGFHAIQIRGTLILRHFLSIKFSLLSNFIKPNGGLVCLLNSCKIKIISRCAYLYNHFFNIIDYIRINVCFDASTERWFKILCFVWIVWKKLLLYDYLYYIIFDTYGQFSNFRVC